MNPPIKVVIDTNVLVGLLNSNDHWHKHSVQFRNALLAANVQLIYLDCVIAEVTSTTVRRLFEKGKEEDVEQFFDKLDVQIPHAGITWVLVEVQGLYTDILDMIRMSKGELNFHDALIALVCRKYQIPLIASYDQDFDQIPWLKRIAKPEDLTA